MSALEPVGRSKLPPETPRWLRELEMLRTGAAHFLIYGNISSVQLVPRALIAPNLSDGFGFLGFENTLRSGLEAMGIDHVVRHDIVAGADVVASSNDATTIEVALGGRPTAMAGPGDLEGLAALVSAVHNSTSGVALVLADASRLIRQVRELSDEEFSCFRQIHIAAEHATPRQDGLHYNPIIWLLDGEEDVPAWFSIANPLVRIINVPLPDTGERFDAARRKVSSIWVDHTHAEEGAKTLTAHTSDMSLSELDAVIRLAEDQGMGPGDLEDAARAYRIGITDNPWKRPYVKARIREELPGNGRLAGRVKGQGAAIAKSLDVLVRSVSGLTAAHAKSSGSKPRGVLFFAGPTGVGKTELAKSLAELLFDDENALIRFDMSEFTADHSADRLIGSPPGYIGHAVGGELTNRIRERPFSLLLFDEIEKAHPQILDKFLQILDDGRLTDGRGETVYFSESVIVFTSNLGIYTDQEIIDPITGTTSTRRVLNVLPPPAMSREAMRASVDQAIGDFFRMQLGRPELLNRLGDNIVVFDFITEEVAVEIIQLMIGNLQNRVWQEHGLKLQFSDEAARDLLEGCLNREVLDLGGRGISNRLETLVVNPLARALFQHGEHLRSPVVIESLGTDPDGQATVVLAGVEPT